MKRILFVDDEKNILDGLRRSLRSKRSEWDMHFATSGKEALEWMEQQPFDVVIADMKMPIMDGAQLLSAVADRYPKTARIVLSGQAEMEAAMRSVLVSHQFLSKPCEVGALEEIIRRAVGLEKILTDDSLRSLVGSIRTLPALPSTYCELTKALAETEVDLDKVGRIIEQDAAVSAKILQIVNSSFFGVRSRIANVPQAVSFLGTQTTRDLVLTLGIVKELERGVLPRGIDLNEIQDMSLRSARLARGMMAEKLQKEYTFLAGLLQDVGLIILAAEYPEFYSRALAGEYGPEPIPQLERKQWGATHGEVGAYLLTLWGIPYPITEAIAAHHEPWLAPTQSFGVTAATYIGGMLAMENRPDYPLRITMNEPYVRGLGVWERLGEWRGLLHGETQERAA
ncbi:MAG: response regulator [Planctomycetota bacterium]